MNAGSRRGFIAGVATGAAALWLPGVARAQEAKTITVPIAIAVATKKVEQDGKVVDVPVVTRSFLDEQLAHANAIFGEFAMGFVESADGRSLPEKTARLETRADRDAMSDHMLPGVANVYFVESLRDVDDPKLHRMGVMWRKLANLKKKYVIVAASAMKTTMAHELGHYLGNDHSYVKNNLMSYDRDGSKVFLDAAQAAKARKTATALFASKDLVTPVKP